MKSGDTLTVLKPIPLFRPSGSRPCELLAERDAGHAHITLEPGTQVHLSRERETSYDVVFRQRSGSFRLANGIPKNFFQFEG